MVEKQINMFLNILITIYIEYTSIRSVSLNQYVPFELLNYIFIFIYNYKFKFNLSFIVIYLINLIVTKIEM